MQWAIPSTRPLAMNAIPPKSPYNAYRIAYELRCTALGEAYFGNALRVAKDFPGLTAEDRLAA